ncbi:unnamed protein product [Adineta steineri]|uniref:Uncharacterized protein n=1 Tax=Adineta steineri TaxID=433720 RepID=A0A814T933_9BILA|nr:unnamed protein product [Adineta steineri]CAF1350385.1 unnamed protein product [Adineta steineri]
MTVFFLITLTVGAQQTVVRTQHRRPQHGPQHGSQQGSQQGLQQGLQQASQHGSQHELQPEQLQQPQHGERTQAGILIVIIWCGVKL